MCVTGFFSEDEPNFGIVDGCGTDRIELVGLSIWFIHRSPKRIIRVCMDNCGSGNIKSLYRN